MGAFLREKWWLAIPLIAALAFPVVSENAYFLSVIISAFILAIGVYGLNVLIGTGQLTLAHAGFFGIGAYATGILTTRYEWSFWLAMPAALLLCGVAGFLVGMVALRTRANYFAIFTLAVGVMITLTIDHWESMTGGTDGMIGVPPVTPIGPLRFESLLSQYYLNLGFLLLTILLAWNLSRSLVGRTFLAIRNDEQLAQAIGINVGRSMRLSFTISTVIAGFAGALYAPFLGYLGPSLSSLVMTFNMLLYLMVGGAITLSGPLIGTVLLIVVTQGLQVFEGYQLVILGPILILAIIFFPEGIAGLIRKFVERRRSRNAAPTESSPLRNIERDDAYAAPSAESGD
jgi:branched-chain amino acid transport system permease protein